MSKSQISPQKEKEQDQSNSNPFKSIAESLTKFLCQHYTSEIINQIPRKMVDHQAIEVTINFDLHLINDSEPMIAKWIIDFYPSFFKSLQKSIYDVLQRSTQIHYQEFKYLKQISVDMISCTPNFTHVPLFNTPIHDQMFKTTVLEKSVGSLLHLKNCIVISTQQPELYLACQYFIGECGCQQKGYLQTNHLIQLLRQSYNDKKNLQMNKYCPLCKSQLKELKEKRQFRPCQEIKVFLNDLSPYNSRKFNNFNKTIITKNISAQNQRAIQISQKNEENFNIIIGEQDDEAYYIINNKRYKSEKCKTLSLFVSGANVINNIPHNLSRSVRQNLGRRYMQLHIIVLMQEMKQNKEGFQRSFRNILSLFRLTKQHTYLIDHILVKSLKNLIRKTSSENHLSNGLSLHDLVSKCHKHFQYSKENITLHFEIWQTLNLISNKIYQNVLPENVLFPLKISLMLSIFWKNINNFCFYQLSDLERKQNIEIHQIQRAKLDVSVENPLHQCLLYEDDELIDTVVGEITKDLEDVYYFPLDPDEVTLNYFFKSILNGNSINFDNSNIKPNCSVWLFVPVSVLYAEKKSSKDMVTISVSPRLNELKNLFDIVLDLTYVNNLQKSVTNDFYIDVSEKIMKKYYNLNDDVDPIGLNIQRNGTSQKLPNKQQEADYQSTRKKPKLIDYGRAPSVSSCYLINENLQNIFNLMQNQTSHQEVIQRQNAESIEILLNYFNKYREENNANSNLLSQIYKIAQASALIRYYCYAQIHEFEPIYKPLLLTISKQQERVPISFSDLFLSILLTTETRINTYGHKQALIGNETSKQYVLSESQNYLSYLFNSTKSTYHSVDEYFSDQDKDKDQRILEFGKIYSKILRQL